MTQSQPSSGNDLFRGTWWSTSARVFLEVPAARCQGLLDPWGEDYRVFLKQNHSVYTVIITVNHSVIWIKKIRPKAGITV